MSVTSIMYCRHVVTFLLHAATTSVCRSVAKKRKASDENAINTQQSRVFTSRLSGVRL